VRSPDHPASKNPVIEFLAEKPRVIVGRRTRGNPAAPRLAVQETVVFIMVADPKPGDAGAVELSDSTKI